MEIELGREAQCICGHRQPSDPEKLAFFKFRGKGSRHATELCHCGYNLAAHSEEHPHILKRCAETGKGKGPRGPHEFDSFYCGCRGWD